MRLSLTLVGAKRETPDVTSFLFTREAAFTWRAGQFLQYTLPHPHPDERKTARYFTIASAPFEQRVMLTTRFAPERGSTFKRALRELPLGTVVEADGPSGDFVVEAPEVDHVFIAGGIGITPFRAILLDLDHREQPINVTLLYANRSPDVVYKGELEALAAKHPASLSTVSSRPNRSPNKRSDMWLPICRARCSTSQDRSRWSKRSGRWWRRWASRLPM